MRCRWHTNVNLICIVRRYARDVSNTLAILVTGARWTLERQTGVGTLVWISIKTFEQIHFTVITFDLIPNWNTIWIQTRSIFQRQETRYRLMVHTNALDFIRPSPIITAPLYADQTCESILVLENMFQVHTQIYNLQSKTYSTGHHGKCTMISKQMGLWHIRSLAKRPSGQVGSQAICDGVYCEP